MSDDKDYAHTRDPEAQRTRYELWAIVIIVVVVIGGGLIWRSVEHKPAGPQKGWGPSVAAYPANVEAAAAGAGMHPSTPAPRAIAP